MTRELLPPSIFKAYYGDDALCDRFLSQSNSKVDVIVPLLKPNEMFRANLRSYYREIPVGELIIGNGGASETALAAAREFPRVRIIDQTKNRSLGYSIRELIEEVRTEWFVYLHSDVFLPPGWYDAMVSHQEEYDWFECLRRKTVAVEYDDLVQNCAQRPFSGSQMGRRAVFEPFLQRIGDDYLYRNEDLVLRALVEEHGGKYGRVANAFHYHQVTNQYCAEAPDVATVRVHWIRTGEWERRTFEDQVRGIVKYTKPDRRYLVEAVAGAVSRLDSLGALDKAGLLTWTRDTNSAWLPLLRRLLILHGGRTGAVVRETVVIASSLFRLLRVLLRGPGATTTNNRSRSDRLGQAR